MLRAAAALESLLADLSPGYAVSRATRIIASRLRSTSSSVVAHEETLMRIAVRPCQTVPPHQQVPSACSAGDHARASPSGSPNETSTWLSTTSLRIS